MKIFGHTKLQVEVKLARWNPGKAHILDCIIDQNRNWVGDGHQSNHLIVIEPGSAHDRIQLEDPFHVLEFHFDPQALLGIFMSLFRISS